MSDLTPVKFLIVDDDKVDIMAIKRMMKKMQLANPIHVAGDGVEALEFLRGEAGESAILPPFIVTLDLNMPRMNGQEFLNEIRNDAALKNVVIFVWTTSSAQLDVAAAYDQNVAGYIVKERGKQSFRKALEMLDGYSNLVLLPG